MRNAKPIVFFSKTKSIIVSVCYIVLFYFLFNYRQKVYQKNVFGWGLWKGIIYNIDTVRNSTADWRLQLEMQDTIPICNE